MIRYSLTAPLRALGNRHSLAQRHVRPLSSISEKGKQFFEKFLEKAVKPQDNLNELLDREKEAEIALHKAGLKPSEGEELDEEEWVEMFNKETGEWNGPRHGEPTKFGDWQSKGRTTDFE
mmetsp:Transcript_9553/g.10889  ORF Transcript_9553/g.10889 Transcript_9553/m.10889 type:complete len:120 (+) Transcript_9553:148-507(+)|eukprot:CAMPEP_0184018730 /NCGR_PEP_ID=MMETSP0954-20121128/8319_1 /TAXON_ID=627963 /ORGANISM="Aplanochytrium sp, Strain PBS07" /LENGTH=119 /DNA_ID=CAMNT_0026300239 /DNA_START=176 /DNA_END=535 /DNA_ORIENTATION=-